MGVGKRDVSVIVMHGSGGPDADLLQALHSCDAEVRVASSTAELRAALEDRAPGAVIVEVDDDAPRLLGELARVIPASVQLFVIGDSRAAGTGVELAPPDCVLLAHPDEATLCELLVDGPPVTAEALVHQLAAFSVFGPELPATLRELAVRLAAAFAADDCVLVLPETSTGFTARAGSDALVAELAILCDTVCQFATTVIAPPRPDRPYRAFLGLALAHNNAPPVAQLMLCRTRPQPFGRAALAHLRALATRLAADLSWRLVCDRLLADRDRLRELSRVDPVLGVANRTALQEEMVRRMSAGERRGEPFSVAVVDVDGLRLINERNGYPAGDAVLAHVARVARLELRAQDIVARYAGDSLAIVLPGASAEAAVAIMTRILSSIDAEPVVHEDTPINLTVSAGIAELSYENDSGEAALARAMAARQRARLHGEVIAVADASVVEPPVQLDFELIGATLGGVFQIRHEISSGAFGVVYRAEDLALGRQVALKLLRPDLARDTGFVDRFRTEASTLARIRNPNLVQVYAFGIDGAHVYFAMELVEGQGLDKRLESAQRRRRHLPLSEVLNIIEQVAGALEAVHRAGMLHRDVKPENVLIDRINRRCVLVDVGIAVRRGEKNPAGTPGFTAPEVFGQGTETPATDVYSLGALAYMLLTLQAPFGDAAPLELLTLQASRPPRPLTELRRDLPLAIDGVLLRTLDPDPRVRPQSARQLASALAAVLAEPVVAPRQTMERPVARPAEVKRPVTNYAARRTAIGAIPSTRGVLFRTAYDLLALRRGVTWIGDTVRRIPELGAALGPASSSLTWHPTTALLAALQALGDGDDACRAAAMQLGRMAVEASFAQFYGANPAAADPGDLLRSAEVFWRAYHSWGTVAVTAGPRAAELTLTDGVVSKLLCASTSGILAGVIAQAGGQSIQVEHPTCAADRADRCTFALTWKLEPVDPAGGAQTLRGAAAPPTSGWR